MAKKCMLDENPFAGYATNESGKKVPLCVIHLIRMDQDDMPITMKRGVPDLPKVDKDLSHDWRRSNLVGANIWTCDRCELEAKQNFCPAERAFGGCAGKPVDWSAYGYPTNLKWRT